MTHCIKCGRPMKHATKSGMGPKCEKRSPPAPAVERDLFGLNIEWAAQVALLRVLVLIEERAAEAQMAMRWDFLSARARLGVPA